jgi:hypothetical protein
MNLSIKNILKTLKTTQQEIAETSRKIEALRLASGEALIAAALLSQLRSRREDALAHSLATNQPCDTNELDRQIMEAVTNQVFLDDKAAATSKAIGMIEKNLADLRIIETNQLDSVLSAYFERFQSSHRLALEKTKKALADFKDAASELAAAHEAGSALQRGAFFDWKEAGAILYTRYEHNQTLLDLTKARTEELLNNINEELNDSLGLNLRQIKKMQPRQVVSTPDVTATTEIA